MGVRQVYAYRAASCIYLPAGREEAVSQSDFDKFKERRRMTMSQTLNTSRDPKGLHAVGLFEADYNKSRPHLTVNKNRANIRHSFLFVEKGGSND